MSNGGVALSDFHPGVRAWFESTYAAPTDVQRRSWPVIRSGAHALITAPTGSGKTLTAFLSALDSFATGALACNATRVLYISPLKALNNDIQRNLIAPLEGLRTTFAARGETYPVVRVATRSGDTPQDERQRLLRKPPEILVTTPESLLLMLTSVRARQTLMQIDTVIVDEIHSVVDNRRGVVLAAALERLALLCGEFQRIALSATVHPLESVATFVGGYDENRRPRDVTIVRGDDSKQIDFRVSFPAVVRDRIAAGEKIWAPLSDSFRERIAANTSTLFFTNSRRLAERLTSKINHGAAEPLAYSHHGSLARDIRTEVEARLKRGDMKAIVATTSLEMGIDIGHLDEVVLIQSPRSIASALQRIGRAGHSVGETSRGRLYPTHAHDFVEAAALAHAIDQRDIEPTKPIENALDVLAQVIVAFTSSETWYIDDLFGLLCRSFTYHTLPRDQFDLVLEMLAGRYAGSRVRDLKPRITFDRIAGTARATKGATLALYSSGGTIPDRGYFQLRHVDSGARIGELDEEFVWEATIGQVFSLGSQQWQVARITHNDVLVRPAKSTADAPPFWRSDGSGRSFHYSTRIGSFLETADAHLASRDGSRFVDALQATHHFDETAADELAAYLTRQREHTGAALPHRHHVLIEEIAAGPGGYRGSVLEQQTVLHTLWGGRVNRPLALVLGAAINAESPYPCEIFATDDAIAIQTPGPLSIESILDQLDVTAIERHLRAALESSGFFGARFRECAGRALLLTKSRFNSRLPLWMSRMQAKKLMAVVSSYGDFPVLLETWRTCLSDEFDLQALHESLAALRSGEIAVTRVQTVSPSPFASNIAWGQITSTYMYADDSPEVAGPSALSDDLIAAAVRNESLRPRLKPTVVAEFENKRRRLAPGYEVLDAADLGEWLKERTLIGESEWDVIASHLLAAGLPADGAPVWLIEGERRWACHPEQARHVAQHVFGEAREDLVLLDDPRDIADIAAGLLGFHGPLSLESIRALFPTAIGVEVLNALVDDGALVMGPLMLEDEPIYYCDADNVEILLRMQRAAARVVLDPKPCTALPGFLGGWHGLAGPASSGAVFESLERLRGFTASLPVWLDDLMQARHTGYHDHMIDDAFAANGYAWIGRGLETLTVCPLEDAELMASDGGTAPASIATAFRDPSARYTYLTLADATGDDLRTFNESFWSAVWQGTVSADSIAPLRQGLLRKFDVLPPAQPLGSGLRRRPRANAATFTGNWFLNTIGAPQDDPLSALEDAKQYARMLLDRYGFVCREIANRETGTFRWAAVFRALRVMELAGEVTTGLFFMGLSGPQFALPGAIRRLMADAQPSTPSAWWVSASDPVAPCGLALDWPGLALPHRRPGNYLAFAKGELVVVLESWGRRITIAESITDAGWQALAMLLTHVLLQVRAIDLELVNGEAAVKSPHLARLGDVFSVRRDHRGVELSLTPASR